MSELSFDILEKRVRAFLKNVEGDSNYKITKSDIEGIKGIANYAIEVNYRETERKMKEKIKRDKERMKQQHEELEKKQKEKMLID